MVKHNRPTPALKASIDFDDVNFVVRDTIRALEGRTRFKLRDVVTESKSRTFDAWEDTTARVVRGLVKAGAVGERADGSFLVHGAGALLGDDLEDVEIEVVESIRDEGAFSPNDTTYKLRISIPESALERVR